MAEVFIYTEGWTKLQADGGVRYGFLGVPVRARRIRRLGGEHRYTVAYLSAHPLAAQMVRRSVIREVVSADGATYREWVVESIQKALLDDSLIVLECIAPLQALLLNYPVSTPDGDGFVYTETGAVQLAPAAIATTFLRSNTPAFVAAGTVTPTDLVDIGFSGDNALSGFRKLEEVTGYEKDLRRNGTTQYLMDLIRVGATAAALYLRPGKNLRALQRDESAEMVTRVNTILGAPGDNGPSGIGSAYWNVAGVAGDVLTLAAIHGGAGPIGFDTQLVTAWPSLVPADWAAWTQSGTVSITQHVATQGDYVLDQLFDQTTATTDYRSRAFSYTGNGTKSCAVIIKKGTSAAGAIVIRDTTAAVNRLEVAITWSGAVPVLGMTIGTLIDSTDLGGGMYRVRFNTTSGVLGANAHEARMYAAGLAAVTGTLECYYFQTEDTTTPSAIPAGLVWWERADLSRVLVTATVASTQAVTVESATGTVANDWGRFCATRAGRHLTLLEHPAAVAAFGVVGGRYETDWDDTVVVNKNATMKDWATPSARPDGYGGGGGTISQVTTQGTETLTAGKALQLVLSSVADGTVLLSTPSRTWPVLDRTSVWFAAAWIRLTALSAGAIGLRLKVAGVVVGAPISYRTPINVWRQLQLSGLDLSAHVGTSPTVVLELITVGTTTGTVIVDSLWGGPAQSVRAVLEGNGGSRIWQGINAFLAERAMSQPASHRVGLVDLAAVGVAGQPDVVLGQTVYVRAEDALVPDFTTRIVELDENPLAPGDTQVVIAEETRRLSKTGPVPLAVPYLEPINLTATNRDNMQAAMQIKASATGNATTATVNLTVLDTLGGSPAITYEVFGTTYVSGSGVGPYVFNRPAAGAGMGRVIFTAALAGRQSVWDAVDINEQEPTAATNLALRVSRVSETATQMVVRVAVVDPTPPGGASVTVNYTGGGLTITPATGGTLTPTADFATTGSIDYTITRGAFGTGTVTVAFTATASARTPAAGAVPVPERDRDTLALTLRLTGGTVAATTMQVIAAVADPFPPGGASVTVTWAITSGSATPASGGTLTPTADIETTGSIIYTVDRPAANTPARRFTATAKDTGNGRAPAAASFDVPPQDPPLIEVSGTRVSDTQWKIKWTATGTVEVSKNNGAFVTPATAGLTNDTAFNRPDADTDEYGFRCTNGGVTISGGIVSVPAKIYSPSVTVIAAFYNSGTSVDAQWNVAGMPASGVTYNVYVMQYTNAHVLVGGAEATGATASPQNFNPSPAANNNDRWRVTVNALYQGKVIASGEAYRLLLF